MANQSVENFITNFMNIGSNDVLTNLRPRTPTTRGRGRGMIMSRAGRSRTSSEKPQGSGMDFAAIWQKWRNVS